MMSADADLAFDVNKVCIETIWEDKKKIFVTTIKNNLIGLWTTMKNDLKKKNPNVYSQTS